MATLPLWFEPTHDYVCPAITEIIYGPVGLIRAGFSAVGLFIGRKSKIFQEQNVNEFQFNIRMANFRFLGSIIKKKYLKVADPLKKSRLLFFGCFDLESGRIKLSRPCPQGVFSVAHQSVSPQTSSASQASTILIARMQQDVICSIVTQTRWYSEFFKRFNVYSLFFVT